MTIGEIEKNTTKNDKIIKGKLKIKLKLSTEIKYEKKFPNINVSLEIKFALNVKSAKFKILKLSK